MEQCFLVPLAAQNAFDEWFELIIAKLFADDPALFLGRQLHDQRDMLVHPLPGKLGIKPPPVIGGEDQKRIVKSVRLPELRDQSPDHDINFFVRL